MSDEQQPYNGKKKLLRGVVVLGCICLCSGLGLGLMYSSQKDEIRANEQMAFNQKLAEVLGQADGYGTLGEYPAGTPDEEKVYVNSTSAGTLYAAMGAAVGYQSEILVLVSVRSPAPATPVGDDPLIHRMAVVSSQETPGLGENIRSVEKDISIWSAVVGGAADADAAPKRPWFQDQFSGKRLSDLVVEKTRDTGRVVAITGATITSKAATEASRNAVVNIIKATAKAYAK